VEHKLNNDIKDICVRKFQYEIIYLYTKVIMHNAQKNVFIYFVIIIYIIT
jgi:hypothetical protein